MKNKAMIQKKSDPGRSMLLTVMLFFFLGFFQLALKDGAWECFMLSVAVPAIVFVGTTVISRLFPSDKLLLALTNFLCALGVLMLYRLSPQRGMAQAINYCVGIGGMIFCALMVRYMPKSRLITVLMMIGSMALLALPLAIGTETNGAKNWISIGGYSMQPSEIVKLALVWCLSYLLSQRKVLLSILFAGACLLLLMLQKDLGTALLYYGLCLVLLFLSTGSLPLIGAGIAGGAAAAVVGYNMFAHVKQRLAVWQDPWKYTQGAGLQIVRSFVAIANGGLWGVGLGLGNAGNTTRNGGIPEAYNDFIYPVILHEFGLIFGLIVLIMYLFIVIRAMMIARRSRTVFYAMLSTGCAALICLQTFVIIAGNIKLIPLTGVTLPFISYGGTSMVSSLCLIGFLQGAASRNEAGVDEDRALAMQGGDGR